MLVDRIAALVARNPGQCTASEYLAVARAIIDHQPRHLLIFGAGRDADLWDELRPRGSTILWVESSHRWAQEAPGPVLLTRYSGTVGAWADTDPLLAMDCWNVLAQMPWDFILVDGPRGDTDDAPGRLAPITFSAATGARTLVHDVHRPLEAAVCSRCFGSRPFVQTHHLRHYDPKET